MTRDKLNLADTTQQYMAEVWDICDLDKIDPLTALLLLENITYDSPGPDEFLCDKFAWDHFARLHKLPTWDKITPRIFVRLPIYTEYLQ